MINYFKRQEEINRMANEPPVISRVDSVAPAIFSNRSPMQGGQIAAKQGNTNSNGSTHIQTEKNMH